MSILAKNVVRLEFLAGFEFEDLLCGNGNLLTGLGVLASAFGALLHVESTETDDGDFTVFLTHFFFGDLEQGVESFTCVNFGHAGFFSHSCD